LPTPKINVVAPAERKYAVGIGHEEDNNAGRDIVHRKYFWIVDVP
jgi:hypothetical protein